MSSPYVPREGSLPARVCAFFSRNPDDELAAEDIALKFDVAKNVVRQQLERAVAEQLLSFKDGTYCAGLALTVSRGPASIGASLFTPSAAPKPARNAPFWIDASTVKIEQGVPMPAGRGRSIDWDALLDRLQPNDSFVLPLNGKSAINKAMQAYKKRTGNTLAVRRVGNELRVWRVS